MELFLPLHGDLVEIWREHDPASIAHIHQSHIHQVALWGMQKAVDKIVVVDLFTGYKDRRNPVNEYARKFVRESIQGDALLIVYPRVGELTALGPQETQASPASPKAEPASPKATTSPSMLAVMSKLVAQCSL